jgi:hypothetical protein
MFLKEIQLSSHSWNKNKLVLLSEDPLEYKLVIHPNNGDSVRVMEDKKATIAIDPSGGPMMWINDTIILTDDGKVYRIDRFRWRPGGWIIGFTESALDTPSVEASR